MTVTRYLAKARFQMTSLSLTSAILEKGKKNKETNEQTRKLLLNLEKKKPWWDLVHELAEARFTNQSSFKSDKDHVTFTLLSYSFDQTGYK